MRRVGHKGADAIVPGNTIASFIAAGEHGADTVELDVLRARDGRLVVAHDHAEAEQRDPHTLDEVLAAFCEAPLDRLELDLDIKLPGYEREIVAALEAHGPALVSRAMVSTMEAGSLERLAEMLPELRRGLTIPRVSRDWSRSKLLRPVVSLGVRNLRRRLPATIAARADELELSFLWPYHGIVDAGLLDAAHGAGLELVTWTVDEPGRIAELAGLGVDGICTNDPRLLADLEPAGSTWAQRGYG